MDALAVLRSAEVPLALVHDEYGHLDGIVTPGSILAALAGAFAHDMDEGEDPPCVEREDGSWLVSGAASADLLSDRIGVSMPGDRDYSTVAGFALSVLKKIPETGETFKFDGYKFEVVDMDGRKIDKLLISRPKRRRSEEEAEKRSALRLTASELAEPRLVAVDVAAGEIVGLLDDPVAAEAAAECAERFVERLDLSRRQLGDLVEADDPAIVEQRRRASGPTPFSLTRSSGGPGRARQFVMDLRADESARRRRWPRRRLHRSGRGLRASSCGALVMCGRSGVSVGQGRRAGADGRRDSRRSRR